MSLNVNEDDYELDALRAAALKSMRTKAHSTPKPNAKPNAKLGKRFNDNSAMNGGKYSNLIVLTSNDDELVRERVSKSEISRTLSPNDASISSSKSSKRVLPGRFSRLERDDNEDSDDDTDDYSDVDVEDNSNVLMRAFNDHKDDNNCLDSRTTMSELSDTLMTSIQPKMSSNASINTNVCNDDNTCNVDNNDVKCSSNCHDINVRNDKIKLKINNNSNVESMNLLEMRKLKFGDISADNPCLDRCNQSVNYNDCSVQNQNQLNSNRNLKNSKDFAFNNHNINSNHNNNRKTSNRAHNTHNNNNNRVNNMTLRAHKTVSGRNSDSHSRDCDDNNDTGSTKKKLRSLVVIK